MSAIWYIAREGATEGPYSTDGVMARLASGEATSDDFIWREGMAEWGRIGDLIEFGAAPHSLPAIGSPSDVAAPTSPASAATAPAKAATEAKEKVVSATVSIQSPRKTRPVLLAIGLLVLFAAGGWYGYETWFAAPPPPPAVATPPPPAPAGPDPDAIVPLPPEIKEWMTGLPAAFELQDPESAEIFSNEGAGLMGLMTSMMFSKDAIRLEAKRRALRGGGREKAEELANVTRQLDAMRVSLDSISAVLADYDIALESLAVGPGRETAIFAILRDPQFKERARNNGRDFLRRLIEARKPYHALFEGMAAQDPRRAILEEHRASVMGDGREMANLSCRIISPDTIVLCVPDAPPGQGEMAMIIREGEKWRLHSSIDSYFTAIDAKIAMTQQYMAARESAGPMVPVHLGETLAVALTSGRATPAGSPGTVLGPFVVSLGAFDADPRFPTQEIIVSSVKLPCARAGMYMWLPNFVVIVEDVRDAGGRSIYDRRHAEERRDTRSMHAMLEPENPLASDPLLGPLKGAQKIHLVSGTAASAVASIKGRLYVQIVTDVEVFSITAKAPPRPIPGTQYTLEVLEFSPNRLHYKLVGPGGTERPDIHDEEFARDGRRVESLTGNSGGRGSNEAEIEEMERTYNGDLARVEIAIVTGRRRIEYPFEVKR